MGVQDATVVEHNELVFTAPLDMANPGTTQCAQRSGRYTPRKRRVEHVDTRDRLLHTGRAQPTNSALDFR
jgi:hypothetical protein